MHVPTATPVLHRSARTVAFASGGFGASALVLGALAAAAPRAQPPSHGEQLVTQRLTGVGIATLGAGLVAGGIAAASAARLGPVHLGGALAPLAVLGAVGVAAGITRVVAPTAFV